MKRFSFHLQLGGKRLFESAPLARGLFGLWGVVCISILIQQHFIYPGVYIPKGDLKRRGNLTCNPTPCNYFANPSSFVPLPPAVLFPGLALRNRACVLAGTRDFPGHRVRGGEDEEVRPPSRPTVDILVALY